MRHLVILLVVAVGTGLSSASAETTVNLDFVGVTNSVSIFSDSFDNGALDMPPWFVIGGTPGPEMGTTLTMHPDDFIVANVQHNPTIDLSAQAIMNLTSFPAGSVASFILFSNMPGLRLSLNVLPGMATLTNESGFVLGSAPLPAGPVVNMMIDLNTSERFTATVNGVEVFDGKILFGDKVVGIGVHVVPEPATVALLGSALVLMCGVRARRYALCAAA